ncbi:hypothetical protein B296_00015117 [Ensete ventricosum]|uniref:Uncharacterized protein n=1 Tax=Ensete ventricosum TaxID=4639 RepID=A0A426XCT5_ENSVE|nr:hypothetical protein B296_00015117 [Ensete ventricosum]
MHLLDCDYSPIQSPLHPSSSKRLHTKDNDADLESGEEEPQSAVSAIHALAGYANLQTMKIDGFLKHQPVIILIDAESTNNFMDSKVATRLTLRIEDCSRFDVKVPDGDPEIREIITKLEEEPSSVAHYNWDSKD